MTLGAAEFDQRVTLQRRVMVEDAAGQEVISWTPVASMWAQVQALRGREFFAAAQVQQEQTLKVRIRYLAGLDVTMRLIWQDRPHDITGIIPVGRNEIIEIMCLQGVKDGR